MSALFARYENFDTQYRMPARLRAARGVRPRRLVVGATYWPDPDIAIKVDYSIERNQSAVDQAPNSFNIGLGWWF